VHGKKRRPHARRHSGDPARQGQTRTRKHGLFTGDAIAERKQIQALLDEARKLPEEMT